MFTTGSLPGLSDSHRAAVEQRRATATDPERVHRAGPQRVHHAGFRVSISAARRPGCRHAQLATDRLHKSTRSRYDRLMALGRETAFRCWFGGKGALKITSWCAAG